MASKTIGFRLDEAEYKILQRRLDGKSQSPGEYVRELLQEDLHDYEREEVKIRLAAVEAKLDLLIDNHRLAAEAALVTISSDEKPSLEEVKEWVRDNLTVP